jgi:hypothetical protein
MLPESLDPSTLRTIALGALVVIAALAFLVVRFVQKMVLRVVLIGALAGLGLYVWSERASLDECRRTCACSIAGFDVQVPGCPKPD